MADSFKPIFPNGKTLASWWRSIHNFHPVKWWVGYLYCSHVETLIEQEEVVPLSPLQQFLLQIASKENASESPYDSFSIRLHLPVPVLKWEINGLKDKGWLQREGIAISSLGKSILEKGAYSCQRQIRKTFPLVQIPEKGESHFLTLDPETGIPFIPSGSYNEIHLLDCFSKPLQWKKNFHFPPYISEAIICQEPWKKVTVIRPMAHRIVLLRTKKENPSWIGIPFFDSWTLGADRPFFQLGNGADEVFQSLIPPMKEEDAWKVWRNWAGSQKFAEKDIARSQIEIRELLILIKAPGIILNRLRLNKSPALHGEEWALLGDGSLRIPMRMQVQEI